MPSEDARADGHRLVMELNDAAINFGMSLIQRGPHAPTTEQFGARVMAAREALLARLAAPDPRAGDGDTQEP